MTDRKAPADFLDQARRQAADPDYMRQARDAGQRAWRSDRVVRQQERAHVYGPGTHSVQLAGEHAMAMELAVWAAWERRRRADRACPHAIADPARPNAKPRELIAVLATGHTSCHQCAPRLLPKEIEDDGRCDICETPTDRFTELTIALGPITVYANACRRCMEFQRAAQAQAHANGNGHRARWEDALDVLVHLHDQTRSGRLPVAYRGEWMTLAELERRNPVSEVGPLKIDYRTFGGVLRQVIAKADPVYVSADVAQAWQFATPAFTPESIEVDEPFPPTALALLPDPVTLDRDVNAVRAVLWAPIALARSTASTPAMTVVGFAQDANTWSVATIRNLPFETSPNEVREKTPEAPSAEAWQAMQAFWRMARAFVRASERASRAGRRAAKRVQLEQEHVTVIRLRRQRHEDPETERDVDWSCRWLVRGHWRHLHDGRQTWVQPHVKGPEDKPFRVTDRVWEFCR